MRHAGTVRGASWAPNYMRFRSEAGEHVLIVPFSRVFDLTATLAEQWDADPLEAERLALALAEASTVEAPLDAVVVPDPQSISLNVSSSCNLSCGYCYADRGRFEGAQSGRMSTEVALAAVERLLKTADPTGPVTVGFLGGEPLLNRALIHQVVAYAEQLGTERRLDVRFSVTTNGTLLNEDDLQLLRARRFAVTVSVDGDAVLHDRQRPTAKGRGSFSAIALRLAPLLQHPGQAQVGARMTVKTGCQDLQDRFDAVLAMGFADVGVSPLRVSRDGSELTDDDWPIYLDELTRVSQRELEHARLGGTIRLTNLAVALKQIHSGASSPYPCGAGGGYFSVAATGKWYACHRAVGEAEYELGDSNVLDEARRVEFLADRHVHNQTDCNTCWARYLCSGSCHQEASTRSSASCDFIRGWLSFCLTAYCELGATRPDYFYPAVAN